MEVAELTAETQRTAENRREPQRRAEKSREEQREEKLRKGTHKKTPPWK
jgi:hypothetical protein